MENFNTIAITQVANISKEDLVFNYLRRQKPIVMTGLTTNWLPTKEKTT